MKHEFKQDARLLKQVIVDQAGDWRKGLLEAVQNGIDALTMAGRKDNSGEIIFMFPDPKTMIIKDNGIGMTKEEVETYFGTFGISMKSGNSQCIGNKGMGRGQIFTMLYDRESDKMTGTIEFNTAKDGEAVRVVNVDIPSLTYETEDRNAKMKGSKWVLTKTNGTTWDVPEITSYLWANACYVPDQRIEVRYIKENKWKKVKINARWRDQGWDEKHETEDYFIGMNLSGDLFKLYDRGIYIRDKDVFSGVSGIIVYKTPISLNFARNDVRSSDPVYQRSLEDTVSMAIQSLANKSKHSLTQSVALLTAAARLPKAGIVLDDCKFIKGVHSKSYGIDDLKDKTVFIGHDGGRIEDDLQTGGAIVLRDATGLTNALSEMGINYRHVSHHSEMGNIGGKYVTRYYTEHETSDLPEYQQEALGWLSRFVNDGRKLVLGKSRRNVIAWTDAKTFIAFKKSNPDWNAWKKGDLKKFFLSVANTLAHEMAHTTDNRLTDVHGREFYEHFSEELDRVYRQFLVMEMGV